MGINLQLPQKNDVLKPTITVVGVGGAGGNAVNNMIAANLEGINFVVANTDAQALEHALTTRAIQLGANITRGLGAGANPEVGRAAAEEAGEEIASHIEGSNMVFITAGMGGGTGTGAAPVVARIAREQGILTVAVVTKPFQFEGTHRMRLAESGLKELQDYVDTLIIIPNQNLFRIANERTTFSDAFKMADEVLHSGVRGVTDLMVKPGLINLDFADIRTVMREMGKAMMGTGEATGERRAVEAAEAAISNPLLDDVSLKGARAALINITGGPDMTLFEVDEAANRIREEVDPEANIIFGSAFSDSMEGRMRVSVVATGIDGAQLQPRQAAPMMSPIEQKKPYLFMNSAANSQARADAPAAKSAAPARAPSAPVEAERVSTFRGPSEQKSPAGIASPAPARETAASAAIPAAPRTFGNAGSGGATGPSIAISPVMSAPAQAVSASVALRAEPVIMAAPEAPPAPSYDASPAHAHEEAPEVAEAAPAPASAAHPHVHEETGARVRSLFQRLADVSRHLTRGEEDEDEFPEPRKPAARAPRTADRHAPEKSAKAAEKPRAEVIKRTAPITDEDQFLDIPAFLRRQAN